MKHSFYVDVHCWSNVFLCALFEQDLQIGIPSPYSRASNVTPLSQQDDETTVITQSQHSSVDLPQSVIDRIAKDYNVHITRANGQDDESMSSLTPSQFPDLSYNAHKRTVMRGHGSQQHPSYHGYHSYHSSNNNIHNSNHSQNHGRSHTKNKSSLASRESLTNQTGFTHQLFDDDEKHSTTQHGLNEKLSRRGTDGK